MKRILSRPTALLGLLPVLMLCLAPLHARAAGAAAADVANGYAGEAMEKAKGHYGQFENAVKYIDPRQE